MKSLSVAITLGFWMGSSVPALAQDESLRVEARGGFGIPTGALAEMVDPGPVLGLSAVFPVSRRLAMKVDGTGVWFLGFDDLQAWHYLAGVEVALLPPFNSHQPQASVHR